MATPKTSFANLLRRPSARRSRLLLAATSASSKATPLPDPGLEVDAKAADQTSPANALNVPEAGTPGAMRSSGVVLWFSRGASLNSRNSLSSALLSDFQVKLVKHTTAALADVLVGGPSASPSLRLAVRRCLRAAALAAVAGTYAARLWGLLAATTRLLAAAAAAAHCGSTPGAYDVSAAVSESVHALAAEAEIATAMRNLAGLNPPAAAEVEAAAAAAAGAAPTTALLMRAIAATTVLVAEWVDLGATTDGLVGQIDLSAAGMWQVMDLLASSWGLMESCRELRELAETVARPVTMRPAVGTAADTTRRDDVDNNRDGGGGGEGCDK